MTLRSKVKNSFLEARKNVWQIIIDAIGADYMHDIKLHIEPNVAPASFEKDKLTFWYNAVPLIIQMNYLGDYLKIYINHPRVSSRDFAYEAEAVEDDFSMNLDYFIEEFEEEIDPAILAQIRTEFEKVKVAKHHPDFKDMGFFESIKTFENFTNGE